MKIGQHVLTSKVILAPMSGVSDLPFRRLVKKFGAGLVVSEMIASQAMIRMIKKTLKMIERDPVESPFAVQLAGCEPHIMAQAAQFNEDQGAAIIDINMGCPVKKIVNGHAGSALMKDEILASQIIEATVKAVKIPVTLKMRTGWDEYNKNAPRLAKIAQECGVQMITVHGRTRAQLYNGKSDWAFIQNVKNEVQVPVVGNGDVQTEEDAANLLKISCADGVMIGRGSYGRPWFLNQVDHFLKTGNKLPSPSLNEQKEIILTHFYDIMNHYGDEVGVKIARKHMGWYSKGLENSTDFRVKINQTLCPQQIENLVHEFFNQF